jgi:DNA recombination protein RmuC
MEGLGLLGIVAVIAVALGALAGAALTAWLVRARADDQARALVAQAETALQAAVAAREERLARLQSELDAAHRERSALEQAVESWRSGCEAARHEAAGANARAARLPALEQQLALLSSQLADLRETSTAQIRELETRLEAERTQSSDKVALLVGAREDLSNQFKALANDILEEKSKRFAEQNQQSLGQLLDPLKEKLTEFRGKVEEVYVQEGKDRSALAEQVRNLMSLNQSLSKDAKDLTSALKGSAKVQGNWGELILERVLEAAGLQKGLAYRVQQSETREDGSRAQPDVVIDLPAGRRLVVDSKVSLTAYERYMSAEDDIQRKLAIDEHMRSVRQHMEGLSAKNYQDLHGIDAIDFVVMFVPIEPAFSLAIGNDEHLLMQAWKRNVLMVSPSTLLFVVRTVAHLWTQEARNRNAQDIAQRGAELYDKFCGFVQDLQQVGERIRQAQQSYDSAASKLSEGKGNLVRQAEMLKSLGVKPKKDLPPRLIEDAMLDPVTVLLPAPDTDAPAQPEAEAPRPGTPTLRALP